MAEYSTLNHKEISEILVQYNISDFESASILDGGAQNTNYHIVTKKGEYVLTICEKDTLKQSLKQSNLLIHLEKNGFVTSIVMLTKKGSSVSKWQNKPLILKKFINGSVIKSFSEKQYYLLGIELAKLHLISPPEYLPHHFSYGQEYFHEIEKLAPESNFAIWLKEKHEYILKFIAPDLPKALIHGDIFYNNIIVGGEEIITIMDFEEACYYYRIFDLGMLILGTCAKEKKIDLICASNIMDGYKKHILLEEIELKSLKAFIVYAAVATAFWRFRQFNIIYPDIGLKNHYLEMKDIADSMMVLEDDFFGSL